MTHFYFQKVQKEREIEGTLPIYKTLNSWGDTKEGKIFQKKMYVLLSSFIKSLSIVAMAKASPEDLKALFDTQQGYDDALL